MNIAWYFPSSTNGITTSKTIKSIQDLQPPSTDAWNFFKLRQTVKSLCLRREHCTCTCVCICMDVQRSVDMCVTESKSVDDGGAGKVPPHVTHLHSWVWESKKSKNKNDEIELSPCSCFAKFVRHINTNSLSQ